MTARCRAAATVLALAATACDAPAVGNPPPIGPATDRDDEASTEGPGESSSSGEAEVEPPLDVPADERPCRDVDLLFVIDNSGSMADEQLALIASFPGFVEGIEDTLGARTSYHVGVVTTDLNLFNETECRMIGALTTETGGDMSSNRACGPYAEGTRFMTTHDDLDEAFACAARVGIEGSGLERPMDALEAALHGHPPRTAACNDGFLRDDALLVLVLITDEDDHDSLGDPEAWYERVVAAKGGDPERIVVLALVGHDKPNDCIPAQWTGTQGAEISPRLIEFAHRFPYGMVRDICSPSYANAFADAVAGIDDACTVSVG